MSALVLLFTLVTAVPALVYGGRHFRAWDIRRDPDAVSDVVSHAAVTALRLGALLLLLALAAVSVIGSIAALYGRVGLPAGVFVAFGVALVLAGTVLLTFGRPRVAP